MLQKLNERIQGVVAWFIIVLVAITFTLFGIEYYLQSHQDSTIQVEVNGQPITKQAFELTFRRIRQMNDMSQLTAESENQLKQQVLDDMIRNNLSVQAAHSSGFNISAAQADAAIYRIPQFQEDGHFSTDRYQQALSGAYFTPDSFQNEVKQGMLLNQQRFAYVGTAFALSSEIQQFVKLYMQTRDYEYLEIPAKPFLKGDNVSEEAIEQYYHANKNNFVAPEEVSIDYIRLSMDSLKSKLQLSEQQVQQYYEENRNSFNSPAQWKVAHILLSFPPEASEAIQAKVEKQAEELYETLKTDPKRFEEIAKNLSDDKIAAIDNGVLPWITAGQSELDNTLSNLTEPGQLSEPVKTKHGYEIFKLVAYKPAAIKPFSEVKSTIESQLLAEKAQAEFAALQERLAELSYQTPDTLKPVAEALNLPLEHSTPFPRTGGNEPLTQNKQVINAAFSQDVLHLRNNSEPIQVDNDSVIVLRVNQHIPTKLYALSEVKQQIIQKLDQENASAEAEVIGKQLLDKTLDKSNKGNLVEKYHLTWEKVSEAKRDADGVPAEINELAFNLPHTSQMGQKLANGDYVIVKLKQINEGQVDTMDKEQLASIRQQIEANFGLMDYDLYINGLMHRAEIIKH